MFSDEKNFTLYHRPNVHNDIVWAYSPDQVPGYQLDAHGPEVRVCGAACLNGLVPLHFYKGNLDSMKYQKILENNLLPSMKELFPTGKWKFMQNHGKPHTSNSTQKWLRANVPDFFDKEI